MSDVAHVETNLTGTWIASLPDYKYLSADGRHLLFIHKLFSQNIFRKITLTSLGTIGFSTKDFKMVKSWWHQSNQPKKNPFSIASILGTCDDEASKDQPSQRTRTDPGPTTAVPAPARRKSILDEIRDLQQSLQISMDVLPKGLTPHPPTPGKEFPKTPATPLNTPKDFRSDFQKDLHQQLPPPSPTGGPQTPPEPPKDTVPAPVVSSLLDLPMPNLIDIPKTAEAASPAKTRRSRKRSEKGDTGPLSNEDARRALKSRSTLDTLTLKMPSISAQRVPDSAENDSIRLVDNYRLDAIIGEGTFGQVFRGQCQLTKATVALKKVRLDREREGFPITAIREVKLLSRLNHENIVKLHCVVQAKDLSAFFLVFEYVDNDLTGIIENRILSQLQIKVRFLWSSFCHFLG